METIESLNVGDAVCMVNAEGEVLCEPYSTMTVTKKGYGAVWMERPYHSLYDGCVNFETLYFPSGSGNTFKVLRRA